MRDLSSKNLNELYFKEASFNSVELVEGNDGILGHVFVTLVSARTWVTR